MVTDLAPLLRELAADAAVVDELVAAARSSSPEVARLPAAENRRHIALLLAAGLAAFERLTDPSAHDFAEATRLGADRAAQRVPLGALLRAIQAARTRAFEIAIDRGRAAGVPVDVLLDAALELDRYVGALERHVIDGYHAEERELARTGAAVRTALLHRLLLGGAAEVRPEELARVRLDPAGRYHCVVADVTDPVRARELERRWSVCGGLFGTVDGRLAGLAPRPPDAATVDPAVLAVVAPAGPIADAGARFGLCVAALEAATRFGRQGLHAVTDLACEMALVRQPGLADLLSDALLEALSPADEFHRELAATALAYLDHGARLEQTARALHVHPNTVRYRLRRFTEVTDMPADLGVPQALRWWWALHTWLARPAR